MKHSLFLSLLFFIALSFTTQAQDAIEVVGNAGIPLKIGEFSGPGGDQVAGTLRNCLSLLSMFNLAPSDAAAQVKGAVTGQGITATLTSSTGAALFADKSFEGDPHTAACRLADAIMESLPNPGLPGIFTGKIAFISKRTGSKRLYIMNMDGTGIQELTHDNSITLTPRFSYNGNMIAFTSYLTGWPQVWVIDLQTMKKRQVATFPGLNTAAAYSPDGSRMALILSKDANTELYTMPANGGVPFRLTHTRGTEASPCYSPKGDAIAYISDDDGLPQLYLMSPKGGPAQKVKTDALYVTDPDFSRDGEKLVYVIRNSGQFQIGLSNLATRQTDVLTTGGGCESPSWTRDSRHIVYAHAGSLYILDSLSKKSQKIENGITACSEPNCSK